MKRKIDPRALHWNKTLNLERENLELRAKLADADARAEFLISVIEWCRQRFADTNDKVASAAIKDMLD